MMTLSAAVLLMCVAVCACGEFSGTTNKKSIEEKIWETDTVLGKVLDELRFLRDEDQKNKEDIHSLKEQYMAEINTLKDEDKKNKEEIHSLKDEDQKNKDENRKNKGEINLLKELNEKNMNEISIQKELNDNNMKEINTLKGQTTNSQAAVASTAFMARMDVGNFYPDVGDVIPFNNALLNLGQHYDDQTSIFTCAESGLYLFSVTLYSGSIRYGTDYYRVSGALMLDGDNVAEILSYNQDPDHYQYHQSAVTAVVECPKGGSVWVECQYSGSKIWGTDAGPRSVFTGFAITYNVHP